VTASAVQFTDSQVKYILTTVMLFLCFTKYRAIQLHTLLN